MNEKKGMKRIDLGATGERVAEQIALLRNELNLTYAALEKRLEAGGHKIPALGLRRIEAKARKVDADDLTALAIALEVSPLTLILPQDGDYEPSGISGLPDEVGSNVLWRWGVGDEPLNLPRDPVMGAESDPRNERAKQAYSLRAKPEILERAVSASTFVKPDEPESDLNARLAQELEAQTRLQNPKVRFE